MTVSDDVLSQSKTKLLPMNPAAPVTRMVMLVSNKFSFYGVYRSILGGCWFITFCLQRRP
jgi:hypothetical protein